MATIRLQNIAFYYDSPFVNIFENLSLQIDTSWKTGLVGRNGRGKTTLLNLLQKTISPLKGHVDIPVSTSYFPFIPEYPQAITFDVIKDSVAPFRKWEQEMEALLMEPDDQKLDRYGEIAERYEQLGGYEIDALIHRETVNIGLEESVLSRPFPQLSGGEKTRALIVALFLRKDQFLLLDEPTNHLDMQGREVLGKYLSNKEGFILVSHDRFFLDTCVDHIISINRNDVRSIQGNYSTWKQQADLENDFEQRRDEKLQREIKQLEKSSRQRRDWSGQKEKEKVGAYDKGHVGHKAAKQMKRALAIEGKIQKNIEDKQGLLKNKEKERRLKFQESGKSPDQLLRIDNLTVSFGKQAILEDFSLSIEKEQRVAIVGGNGTGKTTLLNVICGTVPYQSGTINLPSYIKVLRAHQHPLWQKGYLRQYMDAEKFDETQFRQILGVMDVGGDIFDRPLETFSEGQLKKVDLCRSFMTPVHLLLWDEPLNYIDIISREQIEMVVLNFLPTLLFIEHDRYFVERIATEIVALS